MRRPTTTPAPSPSTTSNDDCSTGPPSPAASPSRPPPTYEGMTHLDPLGSPARWVQVEDRQAITRSDTNAVLGLFTSGYVMHQYAEWLLTTVANILDDDLVISSAGLLRGGAIAWVEVSVPETITTPVGFDFRPNLLATTSFDGSIATTFKRTVTATVCDNTRDLALSEKGQEYKVKHTRYSAREDHRRTGSPGRGAHPGRRLRPRVGDPGEHHGDRPAVDGIPGPQRPARRREGAPASREGHGRWPCASAASSRISTATMTGPHHGQALPSACCRRRTPGRTTSPPSGGPALPSATCSTLSPARPRAPTGPWPPRFSKLSPPDPTGPSAAKAAEGPRGPVAVQGLKISMRRQVEGGAGNDWRPSRFAIWTSPIGCCWSRPPAASARRLASTRTSAFRRSDPLRRTKERSPHPRRSCGICFAVTVSWVG